MSKTVRRFSECVRLRCARSFRRERRELRLARLNRRKVAGGLQPTQGYHQQRATPNLLSSFVQTIRRRRLLERRRWRTYISLALLALVSRARRRRRGRSSILYSALIARSQQSTFFVSYKFNSPAVGREGGGERPTLL
jgi:hypothetical protein